jgi:adenosine deaminase
MEREHARLSQAFDWDEGVFGHLNRTAMQAAFCDAATRETILKKLETAR